MQKNWNKKLFEDCLDRVVYTNKIQRGKFLEFGKYPIVSQEANLINGYWNNYEDLFEIKKPVVIFGDHTQVLKYVDFDFILGADGVKILQTKDFLDPKFFYYFVKQLEIKNLGYARHYRILKEKSVIYPQLPEQHRLVKIIDSSFAKIDQAKSNIEKNLQNSKNIFESYLQNIFTNKSKGWEEKTLGEIANVEYGYTDKAKNDGELRYIRITDIDDSGNLRSENKMYIDGSKESRKYFLEEDDLLMARTGATYAKVLLYKNIEKSVFASYLIRIKFSGEMLNKFYWYFSKSKSYWDQALKLSSGSAQPQFNGGALKQLIFNYPKSFSEQKSIVSHLDSLSAHTKKLESIYQQKLADLEELKKSILQKAFAGEL